MNPYYESAEQERREKAENFVYSCVKDMMMAKDNSPEAVYSYNLSYSDFAYLLSIASEIKAVADEENLLVEFSHDDKTFVVNVKHK